MRTRSAVACVAVLAWMSVPAEARSLGRTRPGSPVPPLTLEGRTSLGPADRAGPGTLIHQGFAYLGHPQEGQIVKIDLSTLQRVGSLELEPDERSVSCAFAREDFGYFCTSSVSQAPGLTKLVQVDLTRFERTGALGLPGLGPLSAGGVGEDGWGYLLAPGSPARLLRVDLEALSLDGELPLREDLVTTSASGLLLEAGFAYAGLGAPYDWAGSDPKPGRIVKVDLAAWVVAGSLELEPRESPLDVLPAPGGAVATTDWRRVLRLELGELAIEASRALATEGALGRMAVHGPEGLVTFLPTEGTAIRAEKLDLLTLDSLGAVELVAPGVLLHFSAVTSGFALAEQGLVYFGLNLDDVVPRGTDPSVIVAVELSSLTEAGRLTLRGPRSVAFAGSLDGLLYLAMTDGTVLRQDPASLRPLAEVVLGTGGSVRCGVQRGVFAYLATGAGIVKYDLRNLRTVGVLALPDDVRSVSRCAVGPREAYFSAYASPARIARVDLESFAHTGTLLLADEDAFLDILVVLGGKAYAGTSDGTRSRLVEIDLASFRRTRARVLGDASSMRIGTILGRPGHLFVAAGQSLLRLDRRTLRKTGELSMHTAMRHSVTLGREAVLLGDNRVTLVDLAGWKVLRSRFESRFDLLEHAIRVGDRLFLVRTPYPSYAGNASLERLAFGPQTGFVKATRVELEAAWRPRTMNFHVHDAAGQIRLALYDGARRLLWQSGAIRPARDETLVSVPVRGVGTLPPGRYFLAWQVSSPAHVASYARGAPRSGWKLEQPFGPFPAEVQGAAPTREVWTQFLED